MKPLAFRSGYAVVPFMGCPQYWVFVDAPLTIYAIPIKEAMEARWQCGSVFLSQTLLGPLVSHFLVDDVLVVLFTLGLSQ